MGRLLARRFEPRTQALLGLTDIWAADPVAVGLTAQAVAQLRAAVQAARDLNAAAEQARIAAERATADRAIAVRVMNQLATAAVAIVRATVRSRARQQGETVTGGLPLPQPASRNAAVPPPPVTAVAVRPQADGTVRIEWDGKLTGTTYFEIERAVDGGPWTALQTRRALAMIDTTLPAGVKEAAYRVTPYRATRFTNGSIAGVGTVQTLKLGGWTAVAPYEVPALPVPPLPAIAPGASDETVEAGAPLRLKGGTSRVPASRPGRKSPRSPRKGRRKAA